ncbi:GNAT family protein [Bacillus sp. REN3]|uniref:GNAT family N-acetyltransferase n=1 Tax=Bacillus sp. REN3 TaxID=2802440 RepID=UPI001AED2B0A|nr:GNAT family protein [Bacillus sp. REN3]
MRIEDIYGDLPRMETERLTLRKIGFHDAEDMFSYASNEEVSKYLTWETHKSIEDTKGFIDFILTQYESGNIAPWGIELKKTGKLIGTIDFVSWNPRHKVAELGFVIAKEQWGKGLTTEAATKLIQFGFERMDLIRIQARCFSENIRSERVMEKAGMHLEGILRKAMFVKGRHRDLKMYSIMRDETRGK